MTTYWCERAWIGPGKLMEGVTVETEGTHIATVDQTPEPPADAVRLDGLTVPGYANCHSHAFHRALRGRAQAERGTFWTWRERMYDVASYLDPESYYALALATYQEMALTGITAVGEFHYLHHGPDGQAYNDPNAMGRALIAAARDAGLRIALLDTCYVSAGYGAAPEGVQRRFSDGDADRWSERVAGLDFPGQDVVIAAAIHSVRAVPADQFSRVLDALPGAPVHAHVSEQVAENDACREHHGRTPTQLLADHDVLSDRFTAVHATHLTDDDIALLGGASAYVDICPTTERDLADGVGPARALSDAGATLTLGSDSQAVIDMHEEMRALEMHERLATQTRGHWYAEDLLTTATTAGHRSLGWADAGIISPGQWADLVTVDIGSLTTAGTGAAPESVVYAATGADVTHVVASGKPVTVDRHDVGRRVSEAIESVLEGQ